MITRWCDGDFAACWRTSPTFQVVGEASDGLEAVKMAKQLQPDVIVMDCALPQMNGIEASRQIMAKLPNTAILMLSMHSEDTLVRQALEAGARGYMLKNAMDLDLVSAIKKVAEGKTVLDPQIARSGALKGERDTGLTARELEILQHIVAGKSNKEIADGVEFEREHGVSASREYHGRAGHSQDRRTGGVCHPQWAGESSVNRRAVYPEDSWRGTAAR